MTEVNAIQPSTTLSIVVRLLPVSKVIVCSALQLVNTLSPIVCILLGMVIVFNAWQSAKADSPIDVILLGMVIVVNAVHS